jgi:hypothetical protein
VCALLLAMLVIYIYKTAILCFRQERPFVEFDFIPFFLASSFNENVTILSLEKLSKVMLLISPDFLY